MSGITVTRRYNTEVVAAKYPIIDPLLQELKNVESVT